MSDNNEVVQNKEITESTENETDKPIENTQNENIPDTQDNSQNKEEEIPQNDKKEEPIIQEEENKPNAEEENNPNTATTENQTEESNEDKNINENENKDINENENKNINENENENENNNNEIKDNNKQLSEIKEDVKEQENKLTDNNSNISRSSNSSATSNSKESNTGNSLPNNDLRLNKKKELIMREKKKQQKEKEKNKIRYLTEEEINLAFQWFTNGKNVISPDDIKNSFDQYFTNVSKNDKKYYVAGDIKQETRQLNSNDNNKKTQPDMFSPIQTFASLKKMLLKFPFKIKDYDNAFSILCGSDKDDALSEKQLNKFIELFKQNDVPVKNDLDKILRCFDKDKDGELGISDLFKMKINDLKKISDDDF